MKKGWLNSEYERCTSPSRASRSGWLWPDTRDNHRQSDKGRRSSWGFRCPVISKLSSFIKLETRSVSPLDDFPRRAAAPASTHSSASRREIVSVLPNSEQGKHLLFEAAKALYLTIFLILSCQQVLTVWRQCKTRSNEAPGWGCQHSLQFSLLFITS